jgi:hypothetical protein
MARNPQGHAFHVADHERLTVLEQMVELAAVGEEASLQVVELLERGLHLADVLADGDAAADFLLQVARCRPVIRMGVRFQDPVDRQVVTAHVGEHLVGGFRAGAAGLEIEVQHRVDDGSAPRGVVADDVRDGPGLVIEERLDSGSGRHARLLVSSVC